ncbi:hypothetical protein C8R46DRAFT_1327186 [Mycena filopes]|nr:hypothetical protein C8R46DRAFT_1327186 [Mycena filopes]
MSSAEASTLLDAVRTYIFSCPNDPYDAELRIAVGRGQNTAGGARRFTALCQSGRIVLQAHLDVKIDTILARRHLATDVLLDVVIRGIIDALEAGNLACATDARPPNMFCAIIGFLAQNKDPKPCEEWLAGRLEGVLGVIRETAEAIPEELRLGSGPSEDAVPNERATKTMSLLRFMAKQQLLLFVFFLSDTNTQPAMPARVELEELAFGELAQRAIVHKIRQSDYLPPKQPTLGVRQWKTIATKTQHERLLRLGTSNHARLIDGLVTEEFPFRDAPRYDEKRKALCDALGSNDTCSQILKKQFKDVPGTPFHAIADTPSDRDALLIFIAIAISANEKHGYTQFTAWFGPLYRPLAKAAVQAMNAPKRHRVVESKLIVRKKQKGKITVSIHGNSLNSSSGPVTVRIPGEDITNTRPSRVASSQISVQDRNEKRKMTQKQEFGRDASEYRTSHVAHGAFRPGGVTVSIQYQIDWEEERRTIKDAIELRVWPFGGGADLVDKVSRSIREEKRRTGVAAYGGARRLAVSGQWRRDREDEWTYPHHFGASLRRWSSEIIVLALARESSRRAEGGSRVADGLRTNSKEGSPTTTPRMKRGNRDWLLWSAACRVQCEFVVADAEVVGLDRYLRNAIRSIAPGWSLQNVADCATGTSLRSRELPPNEYQNPRPPILDAYGAAADVEKVDSAEVGTRMVHHRVGAPRKATRPSYLLFLREVDGVVSSSYWKWCPTESEYTRTILVLFLLSSSPSTAGPEHLTLSKDGAEGSPDILTGDIAQRNRALVASVSLTTFMAIESAATRKGTTMATSHLSPMPNTTALESNTDSDDTDKPLLGSIVMATVDNSSSPSNRTASALRLATNISTNERQRGDRGIVIHLVDTSRKLEALTALAGSRDIAEEGRASRGPEAIWGVRGGYKDGDKVIASGPRLCAAAQQAEQRRPTEPIELEKPKEPSTQTIHKERQSLYCGRRKVRELGTFADTGASARSIAERQKSVAAKALAGSSTAHDRVVKDSAVMAVGVSGDVGGRLADSDAFSFGVETAMGAWTCAGSLVLGRSGISVRPAVVEVGVEEALMWISKPCQLYLGPIVSISSVCFGIFRSSTADSRFSLDSMAVRSDEELKKFTVLPAAADRRLGGPKVGRLSIDPYSQLFVRLLVRGNDPGRGSVIFKVPINGVSTKTRKLPRRNATFLPHKLNILSSLPQPKRVHLLLGIFQRRLRASRNEFNSIASSLVSSRSNTSFLLTTTIPARFYAHPSSSRSSLALIAIAVDADQNTTADSRTEPPAANSEDCRQHAVAPASRPGNMVAADTCPGLFHQDKELPGSRGGFGCLRAALRRPRLPTGYSSACRVTGRRRRLEHIAESARAGVWGCVRTDQVCTSTNWPHPQLNRPFDHDGFSLIPAARPRPLSQKPPPSPVVSLSTMRYAFTSPYALAVSFTLPGSPRTISDLPPEMFAEISGHAAPLDLLSLCSTSALIGSRLDSPHIWMVALKGVPGLPPCPESFSPKAYLTLACSPRCAGCSERNANADWDLCLRLCAMCLPRHIIKYDDSKSLSLFGEVVKVHDVVPTRPPTSLSFTNFGRGHVSRTPVSNRSSGPAKWLKTAQNGPKSSEKHKKAAICVQGPNFADVQLLLDFSVDSLDSLQNFRLLSNFCILSRTSGGAVEMSNRLKWSRVTPRFELNEILQYFTSGRCGLPLCGSRVLHGDSARNSRHTEEGISHDAETGDEHRAYACAGLQGLGKVDCPSSHFAVRSFHLPLVGYYSDYSDSIRASLLWLGWGDVVQLLGDVLDAHPLVNQGFELTDHGELYGTSATEIVGLTFV